MYNGAPTPLPQCMVTHLVVVITSDGDDSVYVSFRAVFLPDYIFK